MGLDPLTVAIPTSLFRPSNV